MPTENTDYESFNDMSHVDKRNYLRVIFEGNIRNLSLKEKEYLIKIISSKKPIIYTLEKAFLAKLKHEAQPRPEPINSKIAAEEMMDMVNDFRQLNEGGMPDLARDFIRGLSDRQKEVIDFYIEDALYENEPYPEEQMELHLRRGKHFADYTEEECAFSMHCCTAVLKEQLGNNEGISETIIRIMEFWEEKIYRKIDAKNPLTKNEEKLLGAILLSDVANGRPIDEKEQENKLLAAAINELTVANLGPEIKTNIASFLSGKSTVLELVSDEFISELKKRSVHMLIRNTSYESFFDMPLEEKQNYLRVISNGDIQSLSVEDRKYLTKIIKSKEPDIYTLEKALLAKLKNEAQPRPEPINSKIAAKEMMDMVNDFWQLNEGELPDLAQDFIRGLSDRQKEVIDFYIEHALYENEPYPAEQMDFFLQSGKDLSDYSEKERDFSMHCCIAVLKNELENDEEISPNSFSIIEFWQIEVYQKIQNKNPLTENEKKLWGASLLRTICTGTLMPEAEQNAVLLATALNELPVANLSKEVKLNIVAVLSNQSEVLELLSDECFSELNKRRYEGAFATEKFRRTVAQYEKKAGRAQEYHSISKKSLHFVEGEDKPFLVDGSMLERMRELQKVMRSDDPESENSSYTPPQIKALKEEIEFQGWTYVYDNENLNPVSVVFDNDYKGYIIGQVLGEGGFGSVSIAQSIESGDICVMKMQQNSNPSLVATEVQGNKDAENFVGERTCGKIHYMVQKLRAGTELYELLDNYSYVKDHLSKKNELLDKGEQGIFDETDYYRLRLRTFITLSEKLKTLHDNGKVHRDLKEPNTIVDETGEAHIIDFGLMVNKGDVANVSGTPGYVPEALDNKLRHPYTGKEDIYALGVMLNAFVNNEMFNVFSNPVYEKTWKLRDRMLWKTGEANVPDINEVLSHLQLLDAHMILRKPMDLSLADPKAIEDYYQAFEIVRKNTPPGSKFPDMQVHYANPKKIHKEFDAVFLMENELKREYKDAPEYLQILILEGIVRRDKYEQANYLEGQSPDSLKAMQEALEKKRVAFPLTPEMTTVVFLIEDQLKREYKGAPNHIKRLILTGVLSPDKYEQAKYLERQNPDSLKKMQEDLEIELKNDIFPQKVRKTAVKKHLKQVRSVIRMKKPKTEKSLLFSKIFGRASQKVNSVKSEKNNKPRH